MPTDTAPAVRPPTPLTEITDPTHRDAVARMRRIWPEADPTHLIPDVPPTRIPRHVAVIMDGNGRWAQNRGFAREFGHRNGALAVRATLEAASAVGVEYLTLYSFSSENWRRPASEVDALMRLYLEYMDAERHLLTEKNIRFRQIGRREGLPPAAIDALNRTMEATANNTGPMLCLAVNYGSREEILDAVRSIARRVKSGSLDPDEISDATIADSLHTAGIPDPDLLIRTAGEQRLSNFLLWQLSYAEIHITQTLWPDFAHDDFYNAIRDFAGRERRFGGLTTDAPAAPSQNTP